MTDKLGEYLEAEVIDLYTKCGRQIYQEKKGVGAAEAKHRGRPRKRAMIEDSEDEPGSDGRAKGGPGEEKDVFANEDTLVEI
jgi:microcystin degradation protein MlrC